MLKLFQSDNFQGHLQNLYKINFAADEWISTRETYTHVSLRIHQNAMRQVSSELSKVPPLDEVNPYAIPRKFVVRGRMVARLGPANRPAGVAEEEGTIRGQIKTRRVTVEWVRNERVCDFGHAVRLYVDLRSTGGTERSGEKEEKKRRTGMREKEEKREGKEVRRDWEDSIYSAFVSPRSRLRKPFDLPRFELTRCHHRIASERQVEERRRNADTFEGKDEETAWKRDRKTRRERESQAERRGSGIRRGGWELTLRETEQQPAVYTRLCVCR